jgi:hypothetical protein
MFGFGAATRRWGAGVALALLAFFAPHGAARAQGPAGNTTPASPAPATPGAAAPAPACQIDGARSVRVLRVTPAGEFVAGEGELLRLAGIRLSPAPGGGGVDPTLIGWIAEAAGEEEVRARVVSGGPDRWGRHAADIFFGQRLVQAELARAGLAVIRPSDPAGGCAATVAAAEREARAGGLGLWREGRGLVVAAAEAGAVAGATGRFVVARGRVRSLGRARGRVYINFGARGSGALTVVLGRTMAERLKRQGTDPESLRGREVLARGVAETWRNGPVIVADGTEVLRVLD